MAKSDPTKDPEFQKVAQTFLGTPPTPHKPRGTHKLATKASPKKRGKLAAGAGSLILMHRVQSSTYTCRLHGGFCYSGASLSQKVANRLFKQTEPILGYSSSAKFPKGK
jgi:hypothetical protein